MIKIFTPINSLGDNCIKQLNRMRNVKLLTLIVLFLSMGWQSQLLAIGKETVDKLDNQDRVLIVPMELHLTNAETPLVNSKVSLNHEDAWLFFDNVKPSDVIANYSSSVLINGSALVNGSNGRVAIYKNGAVVMPHGSTFKPLTVYADENFSGDSEALGLDYHTDLGDMDNAIKSFKLKRGYMATFASGNDGSGYSRVFIADKEDMEIDVMPDLLYGNVSFIRVFKHQYVSKKGKAGWDPNIINGTTYYDWNIGGASSVNYEYVAIRQNGGWPSWTDINSKPGITHLLGFNEPDHTDQSNMNFDDMVAQWPEFMKSGLRIGSPAWANPYWTANNSGLLYDFLDKCEENNLRVDFVALHCYWGGKSPINWYNDLKSIHEATGRPLWITEWNNGANWTTEWWPDDTSDYTDANGQKQLNDLKGILQVLDTASFIERYFFYDWVENRRALVLADTLTPAGKYYAASKSALAYNPKNDVIPTWNFFEPELSSRYLSSSSSNRLSWDDPNGDMARKYIIEKKVNDGTYTTLYTTEDVSETYYIDPLDPDLGGTVFYRFKLETPTGEYKVSNEVSFFQTAKNADTQLGDFLLNNSDWGTAAFSERFDETPLVILGIPTYNNIMPLTTRVTSSSTRQFKFRLAPFEYLNDPELTKTDKLCAVAVDAGVHNYGGLQAEANLISSVSNEWKTVTFEKEFTTVPVIFGTVASSATSFALTVAIQNVTTSGFEVKLKPEEGNASSGVFPENVNFLAIEKGEGAIGGKRVTVSQTDAAGIKTNMEVGVDPTYAEPAVFAGLLTDENSFTPTLRYYVSGENTVKLIKQREMSGGLTVAKADQMGWMIIDLAADQEINAVSEPELKNFTLYPNPGKHEIYFNFEKLTQVEIFDVTGQKIKSTEVVNRLDINDMKAGVYFVHVKGYKLIKFIKVL